MKELSQECLKIIRKKLEGGADPLYGEFVIEDALTDPEIYEAAGLSSVENYNKMKNVFRELVMRKQLAFPCDEQDIEWFETGISGNVDLFRQMCEVLGLLDDDENERGEEETGVKGPRINDARSPTPVQRNSPPSVEWIPVSERLPDTEDLTEGAVWAWSTKLKRECRVNWMWVTVDSHYSHWRKSLTPPII